MSVGGCGRGRKRGLEEIVAGLGEKQKSTPQPKIKKSKMAATGATNRCVLGSADNSERGHTDSEIPISNVDESRTCTCDGAVDTARILSAIESMKSDFESKLHKLEGKITDRMEKSIQQKTQKIKSEMSGKMENVMTRLEVIESTKNNSSKPGDSGIALNIVIRNLPEGSNENVVNKVNGLLKDGLKLKDVSVKKAERKKSYKDSLPGLVIARCESHEEKEKIMLAKRKLSDTRNFRDISINHDKSRDQRLQEANWATIVNTLGRDALTMRGARVVRYDAYQANQGFQRHNANHRSRSDYEGVERRGGRSDETGKTEKGTAHERSVDHVTTAQTWDVNDIRGPVSGAQYVVGDKTQYGMENYDIS